MEADQTIKENHGEVLIRAPLCLLNKATSETEFYDFKILFHL